MQVHHALNYFVYYLFIRCTMGFHRKNDEENRKKYTCNTNLLVHISWQWIIVDIDTCHKNEFDGKTQHR